MSNNLEIIILGILFVIFQIILLKPIRSAFNFNPIVSYIFSVCVSLLCIIGIKQLMGNSMGTLLLPYATLAITLMLLFLINFIIKLVKYSNKEKRFLANRKKIKSHNSKKMNLR